VLMLVFSIDSFSQNIAEISTNDQTICLNQNLYIRFEVNDGNNNSPYTFTYTINGGAQSTISSPVGSRSAILLFNSSISGPYTINLINVVNANNNSVNIDNNNDSCVITVSNNNAPTISGNLSICDGATSQLTVTGGSSNFNWNESNNNASVDNNGLVTGQSPGRVIITYQNNNGCDNSVLFTVNPLPTITPNTNSICVGSTLNLNGSGTPATTNPWTSSNTTVATVDNTGLVTGVVPGSVTITYKDINGCTASRDITVIAGSAADFTYTTGPLCSGSSVSFNTTSTGNSYTWNFGDGGTSSLQNPTHTFTSLGCGTATYNVSLTVTGTNGCPKTITKVVTINQQPSVDYINPITFSSNWSNCGSASTSNPNYSISVDSFSNSSCITGYSVVWGDGSPVQTFTSLPFTHSYTSLGAFNMAITATGNGCSITKNYTIKNESNPSGGLVSPGSTTNLCSPTPSLNFTLANWGNNSPSTTYSVNYGDGSPAVNLLQSDLMQTPFYNATTPSASQPYSVPHSYNSTSCPGTGITATLNITNTCGSTNSTISPITILRPPTPNFTNPAAACVNTCVSITNTSTPSLNEGCIENTLFRWDFGDGSPVFQQFATGIPNPPCHTYAAPGNYTIKLTTQGYCGVFSH
jgi:PKD repeat protein